MLGNNKILSILNQIYSQKLQVYLVFIDFCYKQILSKRKLKYNLLHSFLYFNGL